MECLWGKIGIRERSGIGANLIDSSIHRFFLLLVPLWS
jgi:hypothetical protein